MDSNFAQYIKERAGKSIVESEKGFATYFYQDEFVYIEDIFVNAEHRKSGVATEFADRIAEEAKNLGYAKMLGSVCPSANGSTASLKVLLAYGFKLFKSLDNVIYLSKEI